MLSASRCWNQIRFYLFCFILPVKLQRQNNSIEKRVLPLFCNNFIVFGLLIAVSSLQVSVLTDQVEVQGEKIRDLDKSLELHREKLNAAEVLLQQVRASQRNTVTGIIQSKMTED